MLTISSRGSLYHEIEQELRLYAFSFKKKQMDKKRMSYLRAFLRFCVKHQLIVSKTSAEEFLSFRELNNRSILSILNRFVKYCQSKELSNLWREAAPEKKNKGSVWVLRFLAQYDFKKENSKLLYQSELNLFELFLEKEQLSFGQTAVSAYIRQTVAGKSVFTANTRLSVLKAFARWLLAQKDLLSEMNEIQISEVSNILNIRSYKIDTTRYYKESLSLEERDQLMERIEDITEKAAIALQVFEGLRANEVCKLLVEDVDIAANTLLVTSKGKYKKEKIRLFDQSKEVLTVYLSETGLQRGKLFPLNYYRLYKIVKKYLPNHSPHCLRHTSAQIMMEQGVIPDFVQKQMRHKEYKTTQIYTKKVIDNLFFEKVPKKI